MFSLKNVKKTSKKEKNAVEGRFWELFFYFIIALILSNIKTPLQSLEHKKCL